MNHLWRENKYVPFEGNKQMAFKNFIYAENEEHLSFLPKEPSPSLGTSSPSVSVNMEPPSVDAKPTLKLVDDTADSGGNPKPEVFIFHPRSMAAQIKDRKCKTRVGSSRPPVKKKLAPGSSSSRSTHAKTSYSKDDTSFLTISIDDEGLPNVFKLKDANVCHLKAFLDNSVNRRSQELLQVIKKIRGECDVMKQRERAQEEECEELRTKCKATMIDFQKNPTVVAMMLLESQKWAGYQVSLAALEASLKKEVDDVKHDKMEVVQRCAAFEQFTDMKEPFNLSKVKGYRPLYKKEYTQAGNELSTTTFSWLSEFIADPSASIEVLLSKKPMTLQRPIPSKT
ncbi:hypothetical protein Tco_0003168 [Tanacetum coccineum]